MSSGGGQARIRRGFWLLSAALLGLGCRRESVAEPNADEGRAGRAAAPTSSPTSVGPGTANSGAVAETPRKTAGGAVVDVLPPRDGARVDALPPRDGARVDALPPRDGARVHAKSRNVWVRSGPGTENQWIGSLWFGGSVRVRDEKPLFGPGCNTPWQPIEPRGWVCVDGETATLDPDDPVLVALYPYRPRVETPWPHHYAEIHEPTRRYEILPDEPLQRAWELNFDRHQAAVKAARLAKSVPPELGPIDVSLMGSQAPLLPALPKGLSEKRDRIAPRSALAWSAAFDHGERAFLLAADLSWVPRDRVEILPEFQFQGVALSDSVRLPLAFFRGRERPSYARSADGSFVATPATFQRLDHVALDGERVEQGGVLYYKLRDRELWVSAREAVIPAPSEKTPWGAAVGQPDASGLAPAGRATWIEVSVLGGWLVAFEGTRAVYATMISGGRGGTPQGDKDPLTTASTPTGRFSVTGKFKTATMESSSGPIVHGDVPWTQNFSGPHAIHSAYWHDDWGNLKSAGCVNVAPRDGKWLFEFSEPDVPEGWHGVKYLARYGGSTRVVIHE